MTKHPGSDVAGTTTELALRWITRPEATNAVRSVAGAFKSEGTPGSDHHWKRWFSTFHFVMRGTTQKE